LSSKTKEEKPHLKNSDPIDVQKIFLKLELAFMAS
jgi:hypothetical protein